jgi:hypothetical protein
MWRPTNRCNLIFTITLAVKIAFPALNYNERACSAVVDLFPSSLCASAHSALFCDQSARW